VSALQNREAEIVVEPAPMQDQLVKFTVQFKDDRLNTASRGKKFIATGTSVTSIHQRLAGKPTITFEFLEPRNSAVGGALCHGKWLPKTAESRKYNVSATFTFGGTIADADKEVEVLKMPAQASADRNRAEVVRLAIALVIALIGLLAGAREKLDILDVLPAAIALILLGFGADTIKNLISPKQTPK